MKFSLTGVFAAVLACAAAMSHAAPITVSPGAPFQLNDGSVQVTPSFKAGTNILNLGAGGYVEGDNPGGTVGGVVGWFNVMNLSTTGDGVKRTTYTDPDFGDVYTVGIGYTTPAVSLTLDDATGEFLNARAAGTMNWSGTRISGALTGGRLSMSNLRIDLLNKTVTADLEGVRSAVGTSPAASMSQANVVVWTFAELNGPSALAPTDLVGSNSTAALTARGFAVDAQGTVTATHQARNLQCTPALQDFIKNSLGIGNTYAPNPLRINNFADAWGTLTFTSQFTRPGGATSGSGQVVNEGQSASTGLNLPNGVPLRIKHVATLGELNVVPLTYITNEPALTIQGALSWLNVFNVNPLATPRGLSYVNTVSDPRLGSGSAEGQVRNRLRQYSTGSFVTLNTTSGAMSSLGGFRHDMGADYMNGAMGGGTWSAQNINYVLSANTAYGNLTGQTVAVGTGAAGQAVEPQDNAALWTYEAVTGPTSIPLAALASASSTTALPQVLQSAGFTVTGVTSSEITFSGIYQFSGLNVTPTLKEHTCRALACTPVSRDALMQPNTDYLGNARTTVRFSLPLTP